MHGFGGYRLFDPLCLNIGGVITVIRSEKGFMALEVIVCSTAVFKHRRSDNCDSFRERIHGFGSYRLFVSLCLNMGGVIKKKG